MFNFIYSPCIINISLYELNRLMWKTTPITLLFLVSMIPFLDPPGALSFDWSLANTSAIFVSAFLGFFLQWSGALALGWVNLFHVMLISVVGTQYLYVVHFLQSNFCDHARCLGTVQDMCPPPWEFLHLRVE